MKLSLFFIKPSICPIFVLHLSIWTYQCRTISTVPFVRNHRKHLQLNLATTPLFPDNKKESLPFLCTCIQTRQWLILQGDGEISEWWCMYIYINMTSNIYNYHNDVKLASWRLKSLIHLRFIQHFILSNIYKAIIIKLFLSYSTYVKFVYCII